MHGRCVPRNSHPGMGCGELGMRLHTVPARLPRDLGPVFFCPGANFENSEKSSFRFLEMIFAFAAKNGLLFFFKMRGAKVQSGPGDSSTGACCACLRYARLRFPCSRCVHLLCVPLLCVPSLCASVLGVWCACAVLAYVVLRSLKSPTPLVDPGDLPCPCPSLSLLIS